MIPCRSGTGREGDKAVELAPHRPPAHAAATTNDERNGSMDELEIRAELDALRTMVAMLCARQLPDRNAARQWTRSISMQREATEPQLRAKYGAQGFPDEAIERLMIANERAYDALLGTVRECVALRPDA